MNIQLNGKEQQLPKEVVTVEDLLHFFELNNRIVIVEINRDILRKEQYQTHVLKESDRVELIHFVGGG
ncbi:thiamine biosynthesis protein ThiS [Niallia circulans]|uniref:Thiamine biosynthesis protein ThiS n=1 Tax=Niallia circulans TaxID=1397 RepID=A0A0J1HU52_NIACI|nr:sulfur carrier protein ThiS [Niallia circulans]KLV17219.1 thiamine biosynthesis protein ThiS [Niallia circulans]MDR4319024.1 sulfur carrier protein ThiS [Niallia circulans]MED3838895.1 sulfur carrier protein ThiS [Niallia circulans]MED4246024.1 sulfur carrier protein ThiS [Niallia circulans]MED4250807.1 sulfur carrier protein ThiS [Niallia circulans]